MMTKRFFVTVCLYLAIGYGAIAQTLIPIPAITHASAPTGTNGSVKITSITGGSGGYTYNWEATAGTASSMTGRGAGSYKVTLNDNTTGTVTKRYNVGYKPGWTNLAYTIVRNDTLIRNYPSANAWNNGATSTNSLSPSQDGWIEYVVENTNTNRVFGFTFTAGNDYSYLNIDYGIYLRSDGVILRSNLATQVVLTNYAVGDVVRIERVGTTVRYMLNGVALSSSTVTPTQDWRMKVAMYNIVTRMGNIGFNFYTPLSVTGSVSSILGADQTGNLTASISGGTAPYRVSWNGIEMPLANRSIYQQMQNSGAFAAIDTTRLYTQLDSLRSLTTKNQLPGGVHYAIVTDAQNNSVLAAGVLPHEINWSNSGFNITTATTTVKTLNGYKYFSGPGKTMQKTGAAGISIGYAISQNEFKASANNYAEYEAVTNTDLTYFGYQTYNNLLQTNTTGYQCYFKNDNAGSLTYYYGGTLLGTTTYSAGDVMALETNNSQVNYYKNGVKLYTQSVPSTDVYQLKVLLDKTGAQLKGIKAIGGGKLVDIGPWFNPHISSTISDVTCGSPCSGTITANAYTGVYLIGTVVTPQAFKLYSVDDLTTPLVSVASGVTYAYTFTDLCAGDYQVKFEYNDGAPKTITGNFSVGYKPDWTNVTNVSVNTTTRELQKTTSAGWNGGANSINELPNSSGTLEWFEFSPYTDNSIFPAPGPGAAAVGLTFSNSANLSSTAPGNVQYGFYFQTYSANGQYTPPAGNIPGSGGVLSVFDKVNNPAVSTIAHYYSSDVLKITKLGNTIRFYRNGAQLHSGINFTTGTNNSSMNADVSLYNNADKLLRPRSSFACPVTPVYAHLKRQLDGHYYTANKNLLYFKYEEEYTDQDSKLLFNIYDNKNQKVVDGTTLGTLKPVVAFGANYYQIDLGNTTYTGGQLLAAGYYILEVINEKSEKWYLRFKK